MTLTKTKRIEIREFLLWNIRKHPADITRIVQDKFGLSKTAVINYLHALQGENLISIEGTRKNTKYKLLPVEEFAKIYLINHNLTEDAVWRKDVLPLFSNLKENVLRICQYGFTEIFNNAIDHSEGSEINIAVERYLDLIKIQITDNGIGIFNKIQEKYHLEDPWYAILELAKGKLTTEPESHTGEGIFFTSRMFDTFIVSSGKLCFGSKGLEIYFEIEEEQKGTEVYLEISTISERTTDSIFSQFTVAPEDYGFNKTIIPVDLARYGSENLISRSQAKRLLTRLERFKTVVFDFKKVDIIGRAFADEIFRVFRNNHPEILIYSINDNNNIKKIITEIEKPTLEN
jgi:anti-sigma regulatory factor (Ser/Thr protein kinase)